MAVEPRFPVLHQTEKSYSHPIICISLNIDRMLVKASTEGDRSVCNHDETSSLPKVFSHELTPQKTGDKITAIYVNPECAVIPQTYFEEYLGEK